MVEWSVPRYFKKISYTQRREKKNNPEYETHKINRTFFSLKNVKGSQTTQAALISVHQGRPQGSAWMVFVFSVDDPGRSQAFRSQCLFYLLWVLFHWFKVQYLRSMNLHRLFNHKTLQRASKEKGKKQVLLYFYCWLKKNDSLGSPFYQFTGSKSQRHQKLNSSHTC